MFVRSTELVAFHSTSPVSPGLCLCGFVMSQPRTIVPSGSRFQELMNRNACPARASIFFAFQSIVVGSTIDMSDDDSIDNDFWNWLCIGEDSMGKPGCDSQDTSGCKQGE